MKYAIVLSFFWLLAISFYVAAETDTCLQQNALYPGGQALSNIKLLSHNLPATIYPNDIVTGKIKWSFTQLEASWNPNALVWGDLYPSWNPSNSIATLYSGTVGTQRDIEITFSFQAPSNPGNYDLRATYIFGKHKIYSYYCKNIDCPECGADWTSIPVLVLTPQQPAVYCGDGQCNGNENCNGCPSDCGACQCTIQCKSSFDCDDSNSCTQDACSNPLFQFFAP